MMYANIPVSNFITIYIVSLLNCPKLYNGVF